MKKIASFEVDHTVLKRGIYTSRVDGDITTYDLRTCRPNVEEVMSNAAIHTVEHLFATYVRNSEFSNEIIYFGPMGCRTGFYFLVRNISPENVIKLTVDTMKFIADFEGDIPGVSAKECGNYREHDLIGAKEIAVDYLGYIKDYTVEQLKY
ncbi:MAG TPA: S-ribosylhomocysteine lyase [Clostridiales bacterium]|nr:S-ribosylhomocysteine lyase [Clostridiales bacterium]